MMMMLIMILNSYPLLSSVLPCSRKKERKTPTPIHSLLMIIDDDYDSGPGFLFLSILQHPNSRVSFSAIVCGFLNCSMILVFCLVPFDAPGQEDDAVTAKHSNVCMYVCMCL